MPAIEEPSIDFSYINTMEDEYEVPSFSCDDIGFVKGNQNICQINPTPWLVILRHHIRTVDLDLLPLCQVISFDCVGVFYFSKTWPNNICCQTISTNVAQPSIVVHPIVKRTTTTCFYIFLHISEHPPRQFEPKVAIDKISMVLRSDRSGNVEKQLSVNSRNFWFLGNSSTSLRTTTDTPRFSRPELACPV